VIVISYTLPTLALLTVGVRYPCPFFYEGFIVGMFDYLRCDIPLPVLHADGGYFQTKDGARVMDTFVIARDGWLTYIEDVGQRVVSAVPRIQHCRGDDEVRLSFYTAGHSCPARALNWYEFEAVFDGTTHMLKYIKVVDCPIVERIAARHTGLVKTVDGEDHVNWTSCDGPKS